MSAKWIGSRPLRELTVKTRPNLPASVEAQLRSGLECGAVASRCFFPETTPLGPTAFGLRLSPPPAEGPWLVPKEVWRSEGETFSGCFTRFSLDLDLFESHLPGAVGTGSGYAHVVLRKIEFDTEKACEWLGIDAKDAKLATKPGRRGKDARNLTKELILAKADEMHARPMTTREIAKHMCEEPGFSDAENSRVRELITGRYGRPGRAGNRRGK